MNNKFSHLQYVGDLMVINNLCSKYATMDFQFPASLEFCIRSSLNLNENKSEVSQAKIYYTNLLWNKYKKSVVINVKLNVLLGFINASSDDKYCLDCIEAPRM